MVAPLLQYKVVVVVVCCHRDISDPSAFGCFWKTLEVLADSLMRGWDISRVAGFIFFFVALVALATAGTGCCFTLFVDSSREDLVLCTGCFFFEFWHVVTMVRLGESKNRKPLFFQIILCGADSAKHVRT